MDLNCGERIPLDLSKLLQNPDDRRMVRSILLKLTSQFVQPGKARELRTIVQQSTQNLKVAIENFSQYFEERGYSASIVPTMLSSSEASNFRIFRPKLSANEVVQLWLSTLSGIQHGNFVISLENVDESTYLHFRNRLRQSGVILDPKSSGGSYRLNERELRRSYGGSLPLQEASILGFAFLNYLAYFEKKGRGKLEDIFDAWKLNDTSMLIISYLPPRGEKGEIRIYSKLHIFFTKWYTKYFEKEDEIPYLGSFISSLYIPDPNYRNISRSLLDKFVHYLLHGNINGELLDKIVTLKITASLSKKLNSMVNSFSQAKKFFSNCP